MSSKEVLSTDMSNSYLPDPPPAPTDSFSEALHYLRMSGTFYCTAEYAAPWAVSLAPTGGEARFHVITAGHAWLQSARLGRRLLQAGDLVLLPHGTGHELADDPSTPILPDSEIKAEYLSDCYGQFRYRHGRDTRLVCVKARFEDPAAQRLVALLPEVIHVPASDSGALQSIQQTVEFIAQEARSLRPGGEAIIKRLADILLIQAIRWWTERDSSTSVGWLGALRDRQVGRVLMLIHRYPAREWTIAALAQEVAMSRSALAARFKDLVGESVMRYIIGWRMHLAVTSLREGKVDIGQLAERMGYQSESAFSRAFKRYIGMAPGAVRKAMGAVPVDPG
jgi:AraC-like DNA-binding protein